MTFHNGDVTCYQHVSCSVRHDVHENIHEHILSISIKAVRAINETIFLWHTSWTPNRLFTDRQLFTSNSTTSWNTCLLLSQFNFKNLVLSWKFNDFIFIGVISLLLKSLTDRDTTFTYACITITKTHRSTSTETDRNDRLVCVQLYNHLKSYHCYRHKFGFSLPQNLSETYIKVFMIWNAVQQAVSNCSKYAVLRREQKIKIPIRYFVWK